MPFIIYEIRNLVNDKCYVGMTSRSLEARWKSHVSAATNGSPFRFHAAIRKYGVSNWAMTILVETENENDARAVEEATILERDTMHSGYNAKPGGCGGWIVPPEKKAKWKERISKTVSGKGNPNAYTTTNERLVELAVQFTSMNGYIPDRKSLREFGHRLGVDVPKHFGKYRYGGWDNFVAVVEIYTGMKFERHRKSQAHREALRLSLTGKRRWYHNDELKKSALLSADEGSRGDWIIGRKNYAKD